MKAEIDVRSISASISACAARIAPRTISRVTGSQAVWPLVRWASGMAQNLARIRRAFLPRLRGRCRGPTATEGSRVMTPPSAYDADTSPEDWGGISLEMAGDTTPPRNLPERRRLFRTAREGVRAAVAEGAARRRLARVRHVALDRQRGARLVGIGHRHGGNQRLGVGMARPADNLVG